ncbi:MAG: polyketide synthase dehydratase domain-containing protein, partial [Coleofasciculus sp. Co-bin14]|nr:polyketide synthase dehydratase domain-containing protein [Coleofasciculus sp. Co-bin14]
VQASVQQIQQEWGAITAIIHGAGVNTPKPLRMLDKNDFLRTLGPKVRGLEHLLAAIEQESLKLLITFGSIIAQTGLPGEADYGLANEWLHRLVQQYQADHPHCRCLNLEWSIWSGVGMGERLGRIDTLIQRGITPISVDTGVSVLHRLIDSSLPDASVVVTGRFGQLPTVNFAGSQLPFWRFLEQPRVHYPGVELVVDADISIFTDHYLDDHVYQGEQIFPGVMGLEAMAQVVMALLDTSELPRLTKVKFSHPVVVPANSPVKIRIAALRRESGEVDVVLRSEQTAFSTNHFQATCYVEQKRQASEWRSPINPPLLLAMEHPQQDIYGDILFHRGSFQRLSSYHHLRATECVAEITPTQPMGWFSQYLPQALVLGDPGAKDAAIHALQACIPQATILPTGIDQLIIYDADVTTTRFVQAKERQQIGNTFIYDVDVITADGKIIEHWQGLQLQVIKRRDTSLPWAVSLLAPYLERRLQEVVATNDWAIAVVQEPAAPRQIRSDRVIHKALT